MTTTPQAKFALFSAQAPAPGIRVSPEGLKLLGNDLYSTAASIAGIQVLGAGAALLPLPNAMPILCQCVATAEDSGLQYTVLLFAEPLLSYPPPEAAKE